MTAQPRSWPTRLAYARALIARGAPSLPLHLIDQFSAASVEALQLHNQIGAVLPLIEPDRNWRQRVDPEPSDDVRAHLLAAMFGITTVCVHLKRAGPQPAVVQLALRRVDCGRCVQTLRRPVTRGDECDVCGQRGITTFVPFGLRHGPLLIVGDGCPDCAGVLGIVAAAAS